MGKIADFFYNIFVLNGEPFVQVDYINKDKYIHLLKAYNFIKEEKENIHIAKQQREAVARDLADGCKLEIFKDKKNDFRWRLKARNHKIIAESGEGYKRRAGMEKSLNLVKRIIEVVEEVDI
jgi:uncharacterized protein